LYTAMTNNATTTAPITIARNEGNITTSGELYPLGYNTSVPIKGVKLPKFSVSQ
jgi:hypothetical protein